MSAPAIYRAAGREVLTVNGSALVATTTTKRGALQLAGRLNAHDDLIAALRDQIEPRAKDWKVTDWNIRDEQARTAIARAQS